MRTVLVTGVSRGLGAALFTELHGRGDRVVGIGRRFTAGQRTLAETRPERVTLLTADLADPASLPGPPALAAALTGSSEVALVHNAAVAEPLGAVGTLAPDALATAVAVNLTAPMLLTNAFLAAVPDTARARILFVSSGAAHRIAEGWAAYAATKRGGELFFDIVAAETGPHVTVANVNPGIMDTGMQAVARSGNFPTRDRYVGLYERGELPDPADVARLIVEQHLTDE
jgi:NAD(P)-dependent dehydrogenase (short-subunit alcohol dehydrogenase family)